MRLQRAVVGGRPATGRLNADSATCHVCRDAPVVDQVVNAANERLGAADPAVLPADHHIRADGGGARRFQCQAVVAGRAKHDRAGAADGLRALGKDSAAVVGGDGAIECEAVDDAFD